MMIHVIFLVVSLFSSAFSGELSDPSEESKRVDGDEVNLHCTSWRFAAETNNLAPWSTIPAECADYVKDYVLGKAYVADLERVSEEASVFASTVDFSAGDGKDAWIFDIDETLLSNLPYYIDHGFGLTRMGQYSYSQPSSSSAEVDVTSLLEEEAQLYAEEARLYAERAMADEAESSFDIEKAVQEEMRDFQTQLRRLNEEGTEREQKLLLLVKSVHELGKDLARVKLMVCVLVVIALLFFVLRGVPSKASNGTILSPHEWPNKSG